MHSRRLRTEMGAEKIGVLLSIPVPRFRNSTYRRPENSHTQVIHAPLSSPNTTRQAGSKDWKYSSGWKKVRMTRALTMRKATRPAKTLPDWPDNFWVPILPILCLHIVRRCDLEMLEAANSTVDERNGQ